MNESSKLLNTIKKLSNLQYTDFPFITMYIDTTSGNFLDKKEKNRIFLKNSFEKALKDKKKYEDKEKFTCLKNDIEKIQNYIDEDLPTNINGVAFFACEKLNIFEVFQSFIPFDDEFEITDFPYLKQLLYINDEHEKTLVISLNSNSSEIFQMNMGEYIAQRTTSEAEITNDVHGFHKKGGWRAWAQSRYQRSIQGEKNAHYKETAEKVTEIFDLEKFDNIVLLGIDFQIDNFKSYLPQRVLDKIIGTKTSDIEDNINNILEKTGEELYKREKNKEIDIVNEIIDKASSSDGASLGVDETLELGLQGRIETLVVVKEDSIDGYRNGEYLCLNKGENTRCPEDNGNLTNTDIIEELIRLTVKNGGRVEFLDKETPAADEINKHSGVGALLRY